MKLPIAMMVFMLIAFPASAALFNAVNASPELRVAIWAIMIMVCSLTVGSRGDKLPGSPSWRERQRQRHSSSA